MKNCLFSVSYAGLWGQDALTLNDFVLKAAALGYEGIEIMCKRPHLYPYTADDAAVSALKRLIDEKHLTVACMGAYTSFTAGSESREVPLSDLQVSYVREIARIGVKLGCRLVRIFTGYDNGREPFGDQWKACVTAIRACCDAVSDLGVTISIQNHHDIAVDTEALLEMYREIDRPNLGLMVDAWSMFLRGEDIERSLEKAGAKMTFSTVADYIVLPRYQYRPAMVNYERVEPSLVKAVRMGEGTMDYKRYFTALRNVGYNGWVSYETCSPIRGGGSIENIDGYTVSFLDYMKGHGFSK
ncbi:MAG: sugar phosphate isomerase/epimerase family protein [Spirochaetota bacterium]